MFKFVDTLTDPQPWIKHFTAQADSTTGWKPGKTDSVIILQSDVKKQGIEGPVKVQSVSPIEQATSQAESSLIKDIQSEESASKKRKKSSKAAAKGAARKITKTTQDILQREGRVSTHKSDKKKKKQTKKQ